MPYPDHSPPKFEGLSTPQILEIMNEVLNFASENLRSFSSLMTDPEFFSDLDEDLIQPLYILLIEDYLRAKYGVSFNQLKQAMMRDHEPAMRDSLLMQQVSDISTEISELI
jgi:hypothetical protein